MKQENSQPVKQHKKMNGFADRKLLAGLVFAVGDYMALTLSACLALHLRNIVMTYNVYYINLSYIFSGFLWFLCPLSCTAGCIPSGCLLIK